MSEPEAVSAELVVTPTPAERNAELEAATAAVEAMPGVPGREEFLSLAAQARIFSMSGAAPKAVRGNPYVAFHVAMVGRDLGISPSAALELIDIIEGSNGPQLSLSPQLLNGQIRRLGLGSIVPVKRTTREAVAVAVGPGGNIDTRCMAGWPVHAAECACDGLLGESEFTWDDARMAGLVGPRCEPGEHPLTQERRGRKVCGCNQGYRTYPKRMMWWRAAGFAAADYFPEAGLGLYSPEELGAVVDEHGRPVDPSTVELPAGFEPAQKEPEPLADDEQTAYIRLVLAGVDDDKLAALREAWKRSFGAKPPHALTVGEARRAKALIAGMVPNAADVAKRVAASLAVGLIDIATHRTESPPEAPAAEQGTRHTRNGH